MAGGSVEDLIAAAEDHRLPLEDAVRVAGQVCQGLEQAHRRGIVHRDLKPGNIWLTEDGVACVGDFGLAVALDRSRLTAEGSFVGTALYMAPEQALGQTPEARSDLYSLGCVLYEMVTGRPPFVGDDTVAVVTQHLNTPPVAPTWHRPDCPPGLEALVLRLLEKDPANRPESAAEVAQLLAAIDLNVPRPRFQSPKLQPPAPTPSTARPSSAVRQSCASCRTPSTRRSPARARWSWSWASRASARRPSPSQLSTYVAMRGGRVLRGNCYEEGSLSLPYLPFIEAMRSYVLSREPDALRSELGSNAGYVARIVSEVRDRVDVDMTATGSPEEDRWRLLDGVVAFLRNAAAVQPLMVLLEDLHWSDRGTLDLLLHLARNLEGARLLVVGTYRDVEVDRTHPLSNALAELRRGGTFTTVRLRGLNPQDVQKLMEQVAQREVPFALAEQVHRQTEGHPLFVQEVLRYLVEEGVLRRDASGRLQRTGETPLSNQIPEGLRDVIGKRISRLSAGCNRALSVAAVIGRDFSFDVLASIAGLGEDDLLAAVEEAVKVGVLEEQASSGGVHYRFAHAFFRQALYEEMIAPRRLRLHQDVARALEARYARRLDEHAAELAEHFSYSTDPADLEKAVVVRGAGGGAGPRRLRLRRGRASAGQGHRHPGGPRPGRPARAAATCSWRLCSNLVPLDEGRRLYEEAAARAFGLAEKMSDTGRAAESAWYAIQGVWIEYSGPAIQRPEFREWTERLDAMAEPGTIQRARADLCRGCLAHAAGHTEVLDQAHPRSHPVRPL